MPTISAIVSFTYCADRLTNFHTFFKVNVPKELTEEDIKVSLIYEAAQSEFEMDCGVKLPEPWGTEVYTLDNYLYKEYEIIVGFAIM